MKGLKPSSVKSQIRSSCGDGVSNALTANLRGRIQSKDPSLVVKEMKSSRHREFMIEA